MGNGLVYGLLVDHGKQLFKPFSGRNLLVVQAKGGEGVHDHSVRRIIFLILSDLLLSRDHAVFVALLDDIDHRQDDLLTVDGVIDVRDVNILQGIIIPGKQWDRLLYPAALFDAVKHPDGGA